MVTTSSVGPENESDRLLTQTARTTYRDTGTYGDAYKTIGNSEQDPMVITENNYELKEEDDQKSSREEMGKLEKTESVENKEKEEEEKKMQPVYKLLFNLGKRKPVKEDSMKVSFSEGGIMTNLNKADLSKTKSGIEVEEF